MTMTETKLYSPKEFLDAVGYVDDEDDDLLSLFLGTREPTEEERKGGEELLAKEAAYREEYEANLAEANKYKTCPKCGGRGTLDAYWKIQNGRCFKCGGTGKVLK